MSGVRSALIVASYQYDDPGLQQLRAPVQDAETLAAVLSDTKIGGFEVQTVLNQAAHLVTRTMEHFFADRDLDDLLLVHYSGHGVKDESGDLYFVAANTELDYLAATAISADFVSRLMNRTRARRVVLLLDCCYAGAFERGLTARGDSSLHLEERLGGRGRAVITASTAMEYAFEGKQLSDSQQPEPSVFTSALVEGLSTGDADQDQDGLIGLDELYDYVYDAVRRSTPNQTPSKWSLGIQGELYLARRVRPVSVPSVLPDDLKEAMDSSFPSIRSGAVRELGRLLRGRHAGLALAARHGLEQLSGDDSRSVSASASATLATFPTQRTPDLMTDITAAAGETAQESTPSPAPVDVGVPSSDSKAPQAAPESPPLEDLPTESTTTTTPTGPTREAEPSSDAPPTTGADRAERRMNPASPRRRTPAEYPRVVKLAVTGIAGLALVAAAVLIYALTRGTPTNTPASPTPLTQRQIVLATGETGSEQLTVIDAAGSDSTVTISTPGNATKPTMSPDRKSLIYLSSDPAGGPERIAHIIGVDGSNDRPLFDADGPCSHSTRPAWNADGTKLAVICTGSRPAQLWIADADGALDEQIRNVTSYLAVSPTWAKDGEDDVIVFAQRPSEGGAINLWKVLPDSSALSQITSSSGADFDPDWSDAGGLLFQHSDKRTAARGTTFLSPSLDAANAAEPVPLPAGTSSSLAAWSPSGTQMVYARSSDGALVVAHRDGSDSREITGVSTRINSLAWGRR